MRNNIRPVFLGLAGCGLAAFTTAPAAAKTCPSGQFLQVSKGKCISKASAQKMGIVRHAPSRTAHAAVDTKARKATPVQAERTGRTSVPKSAPEQKKADKPVSDGNAQASADTQTETTLASAGAASPTLGFAPAAREAPTVRRNIAPFGALQFGGLR